MISEIAYYIVKELVTDLDWVGKWAGLVYPLRRSIGGVEKVYPVSINTPTDCCKDDYFDLVPDSSKVSVFYIEKRGDDSVIQQRQNYDYMESKVRLIVWYNLDKLNKSVYVEEGVIIRNVKTSLPKTIDDALLVNNKKVRISIEGIVTGAELFSQYTYDEIKTQYLIFPYGAFGIDLNIEYLALNCSVKFSPEDGCGGGVGNHTCSTQPCTDFLPSKPNVKSVDGLLPDANGNVSINPYYRRIYIQDIAPATPQLGDLWINTT